MPRCYDLTFEANSLTLYLSLEKWVIEPLKELLLAETRFNEYFFKEHGGDKSIFMDFAVPNKSFGYKNSFIWHKENEHEFIYKHQIQPMIVQGDQTCPKCEGTKIDKDSHFACYTCRKTGKEFIHTDYNINDFMLSLYPVINSLNKALIQSSCDNEGEKYWKPKTRRKQNMAFDYTDSIGICNCRIYAWISNSLRDFTKKMTAEDDQKVVNAMGKVEGFVYLREITPSYGFELFNSEEHLMLRVPGNACSLSTRNHGIAWLDYNIGINLYPHNIDTRFQQLSFLAGLAKINHLYKDKVKK